MLGMAKPLYYDTIQNQGIEAYIIDLVTGKCGLVHQHLGDDVCCGFFLLVFECLKNSLLSLYRD